MSAERIGPVAPELRYEVLGTIARGGMAEIQLARARGIEGFETLVAIKRILPHLAKNAEFVEMFLDEARIAATLRHPNIVQVQGIGAEEGDYFLVMEFLHGEDVRNVTRSTKEQGIGLPLEHALSIILGVASALHYAHERVALGGGAQQLIHRDVSPQNVIVTYDGGVKLVDFGIAKAASRLTETREGTLKGKIPYMSPEQCLERPLDRRSDVFSLAVMLWELVAGRPLFAGPSEFEILKEIIERDAPRVATVWPDCPPELDRIVARGLARDREQRYPTAQALQVDLEAFARNERLPVSTIGLAHLMEQVFSDKLEQFRVAQAAGAPGLRRYVQGRRALNEVLATSARAAPETVGGWRTPVSERAQRSYPLSDVGASPGTLPVIVAPRPRARRRQRLILAALTGAATLAVGAGLFWQRHSLRPEAPASSPKLDAPKLPATTVPAPAVPVAAPVPAPSPEPPADPPRVSTAPAPSAPHRDRTRARAHVLAKQTPAKPSAPPAASPPAPQKPASQSPVMLDP